MKVAEALLERETIGLADLDAIIAGKELPPEKPQADIQKPLNPEDGKGSSAGKPAQCRGRLLVQLRSSRLIIYQLVWAM
jgi:hypothetical protein